LLTFDTTDCPFWGSLFFYEESRKDKKTVSP
jgi:hypothetical protein